MRKLVYSQTPYYIYYIKELISRVILYFINLKFH